jgi:DNA-directed RNA polymerase specialized sigma24 family protein
MSLNEQPSDDQLAESASKGDAAATATLVQRYLPSLFDFAVRTSHDQPIAERVVEGTFARCVTEWEKRPESLEFRCWLFSLARDATLDGVRQGLDPETVLGKHTAINSPVDDRFVRLDNGRYDPDIVLWAWQAASSLGPADYSLLDLELRRQIHFTDASDIASLPLSRSYTLLGQVRADFDASFAASALFYRRGRCPKLDAILLPEARLTPVLRLVITRHTDGCDTCRETLASLPAPASVLSSLLDVEPPGELTERLLTANLKAPPHEVLNGQRPRDDLSVKAAPAESVPDQAMPAETEEAPPGPAAPFGAVLPQAAGATTIEAALHDEVASDPSSLPSPEQAPPPTGDEIAKNEAPAPEQVSEDLEGQEQPAEPDEHPEESAEADNLNGHDPIRRDWSLGFGGRSGVEEDPAASRAVVSTSNGLSQLKTTPASGSRMTFSSADSRWTERPAPATAASGGRGRRRILIGLAVVILFTVGIGFVGMVMGDSLQGGSAPATSDAPTVTPATSTPAAPQVGDDAPGSPTPPATSTSETAPQVGDLDPVNPAGGTPSVGRKIGDHDPLNPTAPPGGTPRAGP